LYPDPDADDYAAIARPEDRVRLLKLLEGEDAIPLFDAAPKPPKLGAYVLRSPSPRSPAMTEEIFGPILPLVPYDALDDAIAFVNGRPHPLALYVYGRDEAVCERVVARTRSGGASINEAVLHVAAHELPFGGVGASGMGAYHGAAGFETFSHARSVFRQGRFDFTRFARPPYGAFANRLIGYLTR
ncbi:MAG: aldehyde dehydrogenase family protein, partial [Pseudomonadota bacterium]